MSDTPLPPPGTPGRICDTCDGAGKVPAAQWPSGYDLCPRCEGRRLVAFGARRLEEVS